MHKTTILCQFGLFCHQLTTISPSILNHFWWELYQPRVGHLERLKKIIGYLANFPHGSLRFRLDKPDYSNLPHREYDWQRTVNAGAKEEIPHDIPEPKGKHVTTTTYVDANLHHDQVTGRAVTACLHLVNASPSHWHTKRQATVVLQLLAGNKN